METTHDTEAGFHGFEFGPWWNGQGRLAPLYWGWGVAASLVLSLVIAVPPLMGWVGAGWVLFGIVVLMVYTGWICICVWRSADNIDNPTPLGIDRAFWSALARVLTVGWALNAAGLSLLLLQMVMLPPIQG
ncbi:hypothetical protein [Neoroseomonas soli]|uniref:Uncharacterized protein n=1 Tax=Neoroseomonas soli TaxID=1081025 RepID=A0A9X9WY51_9PROT|nr:hypothetical protein [Neoroseomonas soli]MBR0672080.1 hypothetical protein [Neoroseomonas soli]